MNLKQLYQKAFKKKQLSIIYGEKTYGTLESLLSAGIFFSPNFLLFFEGFRNAFFIFVLYNYIIMFLLVSTIANIKYKI